MINLYYPGQSLLQMPFFFMGHAAAVLLGYRPDGFSFPYQLAMGISALFYTLLGLFFCRKLLYNHSQNESLSLIIPLLVFFGTNLFTYSIYAGCYTHCYSFTFLTLCLYFAERFFKNDANKLQNGLFLLLCATVVVFLRPVNLILLSSIFYFFQPFSRKQFFASLSFNRSTAVAILLLLVVLGYNFTTTYVQTQSLVANTYTIGRFHFNDWSHVWDNFFGFQNGILWYTPLIFMSFVALLFIRRQPRLLFLLLPVLFIIFLYSFWFYWNIVNRTLVDFSGILAVLLLQLFLRVKERPLQRRITWMLALLCIPFFQLKAFQLRNGILHGTYTYWNYYARNFFTLHHVDVYPIDPTTILQKAEYVYDFEKERGSGISTEKYYAGKQALVLDSAVEYGGSATVALPDFFKAQGFKKIKAAFWFYRLEPVNNIQFVMAFTRNDSVFASQTFYINASTPPGFWQLKEFGMDVPEGMNSSHQLTVYFWNPEKRNKVFIDNLNVECILKNGSDEISPDK
jgi:hypothetical protein